MYREMRADEGHSVDGRRNKMQGSTAHDSMQGAERVREATCADTSTNCETNSCNVQIGDSLHCSQCKAGFVPINGKCVGKDTATNCKKANGNALADDDTMCGKCEGTTFMYKSGCYSKDAAPGSTMCTAASAGVCSAAASGYFIPPGATRTDQSIMACNDTAEITLTNTKKYAGAANCGTCNAPAAASETNAKATTCTA